MNLFKTDTSRLELIEPGTVRRWLKLLSPLFFGQQLNDQLGVPIGLIDSAWGGTIIEAWSPPQVIQECGVEDEGVNEENNHNVFLWNSMIHPLLRMTIKGAIWYQGESNTGHNERSMTARSCLS